MIDNGDGDKQVWATEYGVPTDGLDNVRNAVGFAYRDVFQQMNNKPWLATLFFHTYRDYPNDPYAVNNFFGILRKTVPGNPPTTYSRKSSP